MQAAFPWIPLAALLSLGATVSAAPVDFAREVQPILSARCYECHGPEKHKGGFRADSKVHAFGTTDSGEKPIVPGNVEKSLLLKLVRSSDKDERMPPKGEQLTAAQIDVLARWIAEGANWPDADVAPAPKSSHWSFVKPVKHAPPTLNDSKWARNPIDQFIGAAQEKEGLSPSPEADKHALIRRATLDLTGLPPTPAEVRQFVDDTSTDAYERLIDRLLASPHYGERWARVWMDIARYADSAGLGSDPLRHTAWPYRDWVIKAFNDNKPYDQFTVEQIAGDLLDGKTVERQVAVERLDHPVAIGPGGVTERIRTKTGRVRVARDVHPHARPALAIRGRREQAIDQPVVRVWRRVGDELLHLVRRRRQTGQVQRRPANQRVLIRLRRRL